MSHEEAIVSLLNTYWFNFKLIYLFFKNNYVIKYVKICDTPLYFFHRISVKFRCEGTFTAEDETEKPSSKEEKEFIGRKQSQEWKVSYRVALNIIDMLLSYRN